MLPENYRKAFDACFDHLEKQTDSLIEKSAMYCTAQWICRRFPLLSEISIDAMRRIVDSEQMQAVLKILYRDDDPYALNYDQLYSLCVLILRCQMKYDRALLFYQLYLACAVTDTSFFISQRRFGLDNYNFGSVFCTIIHLALTYQNEGTDEEKDVFAVDPQDVFQLHYDAFAALGVSYDAFEPVWTAVHSLNVVSPMRNRPKIEQIKKVYKKYGVPNTMLLEHYAQAKHFRPEELRSDINPWVYVQKRRQTTVPESGMSAEEKLFNSAVNKIIKELPTDVIHSLFYKGRDDSAVELALLRTEFTRLLKDGTATLIVNPSPVFMQEMDKLMYLPGTTLDIIDQSKITIAFDDPVVEFLYSQQFSDYHYIQIKDLEKITLKYDLLVIMARDHEIAPLLNALPLCKDKASVIMLMPQTVITDPDHLFAKSLQKNQIYPDWILDVPKALSQSEPRKKMLLTCRKGEPYGGRGITLLSAVTNDSHDFISFKKEQYTIPCDWLFSCRTLKQMRIAMRAAKDDAPKKSRDSQIYDFSREIKICYNIIRKDGAVERARAYYRNIHRPETEVNRSKGKRPNSIKTERGLRGKTVFEIRQKLEQVALYDEYYDCIVQDIKDYYRENLPGLTLKTMWYCCRKELLTRISYNDKLALRMFCGYEQSLSDLISGECLPDSIVTAMDALFGEDGAGKREWLQLNLIFQVAKEEGLIDKNPLSSFIHVVKEENRKKLYILNAALKKSHFTDAEEMRMVQFLREPVLVPKSNDRFLPRFVLESKWLVGALSLFAGLPIREICPLLWGDLDYIDDMDEMQLYITKHLNTNDEVISNVNYGNKEHYRKVAVDLILGKMLMQRKQYLLDSLGYTEEALTSLPIILEDEPSGRGRKKCAAITRATARKVNQQLLSAAEIQEDVVTLLEGDAQFDANLNAYKNDLFAANFRHKAYHLCGFTVGELCYHAGNKGPDTFSRHYCDYGNDFLQYNMVHKLNRWTCIYAPGNREEARVFSQQVNPNMPAYITSQYAKGRAHVGLSATPDESIEGSVRVEIECAHGLEGIAVAIGKEDRDDEC